MAAAIAFAFVVAAPVTVDLDGPGLGVTAPAAALAKGGGGNGGGSGGGNRGGGRGRNGGGNGGGQGNGNATTSSDDGGRDFVEPQPTEPTVAVAVFTTTIRKRYPADDITVLDDPHQAVSFFNELHAMTGKQITHRWKYEDDVKFTASFDVMSDRWRIWSTQLLPADMAGEWTVEVVDEDGVVLEARSLVYLPTAAEHVAVK